MGSANDWGYTGGLGRGTPDARLQDAYQDLLGSNDLLNTDSYSRDTGDMYMDSEVLEAHLEQLPPDQRRNELQVRCTGSAASCSLHLLPAALCICCLVLFTPVCQARRRPLSS
jgi:hypothetical protein